jgi:tetratricopeptide (TPR) repeat protein
MMGRAAAALFLVLLTVSCTSHSPEPPLLESADAAFSKGEYLEAERLYESYLQSHPEDSGRWRAWNRLLAISGAVRKTPVRSIQLLEAMRLEFIEDHARLWEVLLALGKEYRARQELEKAVATFQAALEIPGRASGEYIDARFLLYESHRKAENYDLARSVLADGLSRDTVPGQRGALLLELSNLAIYTGDLQDARKKLEELVAIECGTDLKPLAIFSLADVAERQGDLQRSRELFVSIVETHPNPAAVQARIAGLDQAREGKPAVQ